MTDAEHAHVLRHMVEKYDIDFDFPSKEGAAIERAIELLEREAPCHHCGGGGAHPGACRWCGKSR